MVRWVTPIQELKKSKVWRKSPKSIGMPTPPFFHPSCLKATTSPRQSLATMPWSAFFKLKLVVDPSPMKLISTNQCDLVWNGSAKNTILVYCLCVCRCVTEVWFVLCIPILAVLGELHPGPGRLASVSFEQHRRHVSALKSRPFWCGAVFLRELAEQLVGRPI